MHKMILYCIIFTAYRIDLVDLVLSSVSAGIFFFGLFGNILRISIYFYLYLPNFILFELGFMVNPWKLI